MHIDWGATFIELGGLVAVGEAARRWVVKPVAEILDRSRQRDEDWNGTEPRPGVPGRPGVMARLGSLEGLAQDTNDRVVKLEQAKELAHEEALRMWAAIEAVAKSRPPEA